MKISHECPISIFDKVQKLTHYDYCLVHLFQENEEYRRHFLEAKLKKREIILDNSIFELGVAFNSERYAKVVQELQPDWYIVPDVLEDSKATIQSYKKFCKTYKDLPGKKIGVIQGKSFEELEECYRELVLTGVDKIAISFDYSYYLELSKDVVSTNEYRFIIGRQRFLKKFIQSATFLSNSKSFHLLGCFLPQEFQIYKTKEFQGVEIDSVDTSNPVVHGLKYIPYTNTGLLTKESQKLFTLINSEVNQEQLSIIESNIIQFRKFCNE